MNLETGLPPCVHEGHPHRGKLCLFHPSIHASIRLSNCLPEAPLFTLGPSPHNLQSSADVPYGALNRKLQRLAPSPIQSTLPFSQGP